MLKHFDPVTPQDVLRLSRTEVKERWIGNVLDDIWDETSAVLNQETFLINSPMNTGKSQLMKEVMNRYMPRISGPVLEGKPLLPRTNTDNFKVLAVTHRISLCSAISNEFAMESFKFKKYSEIRSDNLNSCNRLVVQMDSVRRIGLDDKQELPVYDLIILDEITSMLNHLKLADTLSKGTRRWDCFLTFYNLVHLAKRVIALDADIGNLAIKFLLTFRRGNLRWIKNSYRFDMAHIFPLASCNGYNGKCDGTCGHRHYLIEPCVHQFLQTVKSDIKAGLKMAIACSSANTAELIRDYITEFIESSGLPPKRSFLYTRGTKNDDQASAKDTALSNVNDPNEGWTNLDILVYSPMICTGINFTARHFDRLYGVFTSGSCCAREFGQMLNRVRYLTSGAKITICCPEAPKDVFLPIDYPTVLNSERLIKKKSETLGAENLRFFEKLWVLSTGRKDIVDHYMLGLAFCLTERNISENHPASALLDYLSTTYTVEFVKRGLTQSASIYENSHSSSNICINPDFVEDSRFYYANAVAFPTTNSFHVKLRKLNDRIQKETIEKGVYYEQNPPPGMLISDPFTGQRKRKRQKGDIHSKDPVQRTDAIFSIYSVEKLPENPRHLKMLYTPKNADDFMTFQHLCVPWTFWYEQAKMKNPAILEYWEHPIRKFVQDDVIKPLGVDPDITKFQFEKDRVYHLVEHLRTIDKNYLTSILIHKGLIKQKKLKSVEYIERLLEPPDPKIVIEFIKDVLSSYCGVKIKIDRNRAGSRTDETYYILDEKGQLFAELAKKGYEKHMQSFNSQTQTTLEHLQYRSFDNSHPHLQ